MRILHIIHSLRRGGAERICLNLACGMANGGHQTCVVSLLNHDDYDDIDRVGVEVRYLIPVASFRWPSSCRTLSRRLRSELEWFRPDAILTHTPTATMVLGVVKPACPIVSVFHGYGDDWRPGASMKQRLFLALHKWALRRVDAGAIVVSQGLASVVHRRIGISQRKITCIPNGVDLKAFRPGPMRMTVRPEVLVIGTLSEIKRPLDAVGAFAKLLETVQDARLSFVGDGPIRLEVEKCVSRLDLGRMVRFLGKRQDVPEILRGADLVWHLSRSEGMPLACVEAMACGVPVVGTRVGGIPEVVRNGQTGFLVEVGDVDAVAALSARLLADKELYARVRTASIADASERFDQRRMVREYVELLKESVRQMRANVAEA
jgi:L-malate glycosyltransferase